MINYTYISKFERIANLTDGPIRGQWREVAVVGLQDDELVPIQWVRN